METTLLLTWTPVAPVAPIIDRSRLAARIYRSASNRWVVLLRDIVYDGAPKMRYVSQRDFEMLSDAEAFAQNETGKPAKVTFAREVSFGDMRAPRGISD